MKNILFIAFLLGPTFLKATIQDVSQLSQLEVSVVLYPQDMALIKEKRKVSLIKGSNKLLITGVPSSILMDSFLFQALPPSPPLTILEYTFQAPHITQEELLENSIGETVHLLPLSPTATPTTAKLIALDGDDALIQAMELIFSVKKGRVAFSHLPYALVSEPRITLKVSSPKEEEAFFEMGYLAKGFSWDAGYTVVVDVDGSHLDLNNWTNIHNKSGMDIKKGHFRIAHAQQTTERFYDIERPVSLADKAVKNISWLSAANLTPTKSFRIYPKNNILINEEGVVMKPTVETWFSVLNDKDHGLGSPLPQGIIKVFRRNKDGSLFYIGENKTPRTLIGKALSLRVGNTKEITVEMRQTDYRKLGSKVVESGYRVDLKNTTDVPKQVTVFQSVSHEWIILRETHPHEEEEKRLKWILNLAAQEEVSLRYRIRMNMD